MMTAEQAASLMMFGCVTKTALPNDVRPMHVHKVRTVEDAVPSTLNLLEVFYSRVESLLFCRSFD